MIPLENLATITQTTTPQVISHYNLFRSAEIDGSPGSGYSSGQVIAAMEDLSKRVDPGGFTYEWTGLSLEELASGSTTVILFGLGSFGVVYLTLSAQYEGVSSWSRIRGITSSPASGSSASTASKKAPEVGVCSCGRVMVSARSSSGKLEQVVEQLA